MAILRNKEIIKMNQKIKDSKLKDLKMELIKSQVIANKTNAKHKEIKKAIARLLTSNRVSDKITESVKEGVDKK